MVHGTPVTVSTERVKLAYILNGTDSGTNTFNPAVDATPAVAALATLPQPVTRTTRSGRHVHFTDRFNI
jgi:hypothetical protein